MNLRLDVAYDGAPFHGFARQPAVPTVQGTIEDALARVLRHEVTTVGAGRTDAGVHAIGQVMSAAEVPEVADTVELRDSLNVLCGPSIAVRKCSSAPPDFDARFSARSRTYVYAVVVGPVPDPWLARTSLHHPGELDVARMNEAAGHLVGMHDFASFGRVGEGKSSERTLFELAVSSSGRILRIRARANAFIQQMVRSLAGTLIDVGAGRRTPDGILAVLAARDRAAAGPVVPPHGLCLVAVEYDSGWSGPFDQGK